MSKRFASSLEQDQWRRADALRRNLGRGEWWTVERYQAGRKFAFWYLARLREQQPPNEAELVDALLHHAAQNGSAYEAGVQSAVRITYRASAIRNGLRAKRVAIKCFGYATTRCAAYSPLQVAWIVRGLLAWGDATALLGADYAERAEQRFTLTRRLTQVLDARRNRVNRVNQGEWPLLPVMVTARVNEALAREGAF